MMYVEVLRNSDEGFWEIDIEEKKALFRNFGHKLPPNERIHDWEEIYTNIQDFLREKLDAKVIKEIIPEIKYVYNTENTPFCSWFMEGVVASDPTRRIHCNREASFYKNGKPYCQQHASVSF